MLYFKRSEELSYVESMEGKRNRNGKDKIFEF